MMSYSRFPGFSQPMVQTRPQLQFVNKVQYLGGAFPVPSGKHRQVPIVVIVKVQGPVVNQVQNVESRVHPMHRHVPMAHTVRNVMHSGHVQHVPMVHTVWHGPVRQHIGEPRFAERIGRSTNEKQAVATAIYASEQIAAGVTDGKKCQCVHPGKHSTFACGDPPRRVGKMEEEVVPVAAVYAREEIVADGLDSKTSQCMHPDKSLMFARGHCPRRGDKTVQQAAAVAVSDGEDIVASVEGATRCKSKESAESSDTKADEATDLDLDSSSSQGVASVDNHEPDDRETVVESKRQQQLQGATEGPFCRTDWDLLEELDKLCTMRRPEDEAVHAVVFAESQHDKFDMADQKRRTTPRVRFEEDVVGTSLHLTSSFVEEAPRAGHRRQATQSVSPGHPSVTLPEQVSRFGHKRERSISGRAPRRAALELAAEVAKDNATEDPENFGP